MRALRSITVAAAALALASCTEATDPVAAGPDALFSRHGELRHRVVGSGHAEGQDGLREFTFHAVERADGTATGSYKIVLPNGLFLEVDVTCLSVDGATGWVAGTIRDTNAGIVEIGSRSMFYAVDGGEGAGSGDVVSLAALNMPEGADLEFCEEQPLLLPQLTVTQGNVQVR